MRVVGVGTDLVDVQRFTHLLDRGGTRFLDRWFLPTEVDALLSRSEPSRHTAALFAAKEAVLKALRVPDTGPVRWREIEIIRDTDGRPGVTLHGSIRAVADAAQVTRFHVALADSGRVATATVVAISES